MTRSEAKARERRLLATANAQYGLLRAADLLAEGLTRDQIDRRLAHCRLNRIQRGVYALGHTAVRDEARWLATLWGCREGTVLSHVTAAAYHRMGLDVTHGPVHVSSTSRAKRRPGVVTHQVRHLVDVDVFRSGPFVVTRIPRTLVDLADVLTWAEYRALADAQPSLRVDRIREAQARTPFRPGAPLVTRLVDADDAHTRSEFERRYLRFAAAYGVPRPDGLNERVAGHRADCVYRAARLVVELDGRAFHRRRSQMRADRRRDRGYQRAGNRIIRLVWDDLHHGEAPATAELLLDMLGDDGSLGP